MADRNMPIAGGCLCGAVRFEATAPPTWVGHCHCRMCQRAYGQPSGLFVAFKEQQKDAFRFTQGMPTYYRSSAWLERGFCATCGSPLGIRTPQGHSVMVGTLDHPEDWPPDAGHSGIESQIPWNVIHDDLPRTRTEDDPDFIAARKAAEQNKV
jgi:adenylate cyclase